MSVPEVRVSSGAPGHRYNLQRLLPSLLSSLWRAYLGNYVQNLSENDPNLFSNDMSPRTSPHFALFRVVANPETNVTRSTNGLLGDRFVISSKQ
jgi:hypothetical protein